MEIENVKGRKKGHLGGGGGNTKPLGCNALGNVKLCGGCGGHYRRKVLSLVKIRGE